MFNQHEKAEWMTLLNKLNTPARQRFALRVMQTLQARGQGTATPEQIRWLTRLEKLTPRK